MANSSQSTKTWLPAVAAVPSLQLGVGPAPIPLPDLTAERLLTALHQLVKQQEQYSAAAAKVANELGNEDGLAAAVASVARTMSAPRPFGGAASTPSGQQALLQ
jgi:hypothetical protein